MTERRWTIAAGLPPEIGFQFVRQFVNFARIDCWLPLAASHEYTMCYSRALYARFVEKLKQSEPWDRHTLLGNVRLVVLYLDKGDGSDRHLHSQFGSEALVIPFGASEIWTQPLITTNQKNRAIGLLVRDGKVALRHAGALLGIIAKEVGDHDNITCLLLPPKNFGRKALAIWNCVYEASVRRQSGDEFFGTLRLLANSISSQRKGNNRYFVGRNKIVYQSPPKARDRHGCAPGWDTNDHDTTCVIRGRIRFGVSFDPHFHYDCNLAGSGKRTFDSCHGTETIPKGRKHVNISPNDNIR